MIASRRAIFDGLRDLTGVAKGGCLIYVTSHGAPQGVVLGDSLLTPGGLADLLDRTCPARPAVVIISACFSGVFVPIVQGPNRMIFTAARRDRSSFGCGVGDTYPFFDGCVLEALPAARDFIALVPLARACVIRRERMEHVQPPSAPQVSVGAAFRSNLAPFAARPG